MATQNAKRVFVCGVGMTKVSTFTRFTTAHILHPTNILQSFRDFLCEYIKYTNRLVLVLCLQSINQSINQFILIIAVTLPV